MLTWRRVSICQQRIWRSTPTIRCRRCSTAISCCTSSNAILRYLCHKHDLSGWYPADPKHRARVEQWLDWNQCRLSPAVIDIVRNKLFRGDKGDKEAIVRGEANLRELAPILDAGLAAQDFLTGPKPTIADLAVASNLFQLGLAQATPPGANIAAWYQRIGALDAFRKSLPPA